LILALEIVGAYDRVIAAVPRVFKERIPLMTAGKLFKQLLVFSLLISFTLWSGCGNDSETGRPGGAQKTSRKIWKLAFVTNNAADFWSIARAGCEKAEEELKDVKVEFRIPDDASAATQKRMIDDMLAKGIDGFAISPVNPDNQVTMLNRAAKQALVVTQDSDAELSDRAFYIGTDNVEAGREAGGLIKEVLPSGGKIMLFVGKRDAANARERIQGIEEAVKGSGIEIVDVRTDDTDLVRAKANVKDTLVSHPDVVGMVGLWNYNGPAIYNAVREAEDSGRIKKGQIKIVCFDEDDATLAGVKEGAIYGTIVQQPFEFGRRAIKLMRRHLMGDTSFVPSDRKIIVPTLRIRSDNVNEFKARLYKLLGRK
jgi:ribose transport system substrate-binding protein